MAKMDASDMVSYVRQSIGSPPTSEIGNDDILRRINQVYMRMGIQLPMPEIYTSTTVTTSSGTAAYSVGTSVLKMLDVSNTTSGTTLRWITPNQYEKYLAASSTTGTPQYCVQSYSSTNATTFIKFYPTPDGVYTIRVAYVTEPTELVTSPAANYTDFSDAWDEVICVGAAASCALQIGDFQRAAALRQEYQKLISEIYPAQIKGTQQVTRIRAPWSIGG